MRRNPVVVASVAAVAGAGLVLQLAAAGCGAGRGPAGPGGGAGDEWGRATEPPVAVCGDGVRVPTSGVAGGHVCAGHGGVARWTDAPGARPDVRPSRRVPGGVPGGVPAPPPRRPPVRGR